MFFLLPPLINSYIWSNTLLTLPRFLSLFFPFSHIHTHLFLNISYTFSTFHPPKTTSYAIMLLTKSLRCLKINDLFKFSSEKKKHDTVNTIQFKLSFLQFLLNTSIIICGSLRPRGLLFLSANLLEGSVQSHLHSVFEAFSLPWFSHLHTHLFMPFRVCIKYNRWHHTLIPYTYTISDTCLCW